VTEFCEHGDETSGSYFINQLRNRKLLKKVFFQFGQLIIIVINNYVCSSFCGKHGVPMVCLWCTHGVLMVCPRAAIKPVSRTDPKFLRLQAMKP